MSRAPPAWRLRVRTLCRIAPRSTSAQVRLGTLGRTRSIKRFSEAGFEDVEGEDIHAGYHSGEPLALDDGQYLLAPVGHDRRGLGEGGFRSDGYRVLRHHLADGDARALERLPAVLLRVPERHDAAEDVEKARRLYLRVLEDQVALGDYPDEPLALHDRGPGDTFLGEELDRLLHGALGSQGRPVGLHDVPDLEIPNVLPLQALNPFRPVTLHAADTTLNTGFLHHLRAFWSSRDSRISFRLVSCPYLPAKPPEVEAHEGRPASRLGPPGRRGHRAGDLEKLEIKVVQNVGRVVGEAGIGERLARVVQRPSHRPSQHQAPSDADRTDGIEAVGVLYLRDQPLVDLAEGTRQMGQKVGGGHALGGPAGGFEPEL